MPDIQIITDEQQNAIKKMVDDKVKTVLAKATGGSDPRDNANYKRWMEGLGGSPFGDKIEGNDKAASNEAPRMDSRSMIKSFLDSEAVKDFANRKEEKSKSFAPPVEKFWMPGNPIQDRTAQVSGSSSLRTQLATDYETTIQLTPNRKVRWRDFIPVMGTKVGDIKFLKEAASTNNTTMMPENIDPASTTSATASVAGVTLGSASVKTLTTFIEFPEQLMEDIEELQMFLENRLENNCLDTEDLQIASGDGTGNNMEGYFVDAGVQSQLWSAGDLGDTMADAVLNAMVKAWVANYEPDLSAFYPSDFARIVKDKDGQGRYQIPVVHQDYAPNRLWGKPVIVSTAVPVGKSITGAFQRYGAIRDRKAPTFFLSRENKDLKEQNIVALFINARVASYRYRSDAFVKVTFDAAP